MINSINKIVDNRTLRYIQDFMNGCSIEEKIDTHYITVDIISKNEIRIRKANGNEIDRVDLILNSMWNNLFLDWNYLKLSNPEWFKDHVGYTISMFYFPCDTPILTKYDSTNRYVLDKMYFNEQEVDISCLNEIKFPTAYKIGYKQTLNKIKDVNTYFEQHKNELLNKENVTSIFEGLIDKNNSKIWALDKPEGYIFKFNNKLFQSENNEIRKISKEKTSYEFLLAEFIKYCKISNYTDKVSNQSYVKTVCNLFNDYIVNCEKKNHTIENNIEIDSLENPNLGKKFDIGYEYIPDQVTKTLCQESLLYKNIFKVLLANLRKGKDFKHCIYLNKKQVDEWNTIMKNIKFRIIGYNY